MGQCSICNADSSQDDSIATRLRNNIIHKNQYGRISDDSDSEDYVVEQLSSEMVESSVSSRIAMFQPKNQQKQSNNKKYKPKNKTNKLKNMFEKMNKNSNTSKTTSKKASKTASKNTKIIKKWKVKGIDVPHDKPDTEPIKAVSNTVSSSSEIHRGHTDSLSLKERLNKYSKDVESFDDRQRQRISAHKQNRSGYEGIQISAEQKQKVRDLLKKRVEKQKNSSMTSDMMGMMSMNKSPTAFISAANTYTNSDDALPDVDGDFARPSRPGRKRRGKRKVVDTSGVSVSSSSTQTLSDILKNAERIDSYEIVSNFGLFQATEKPQSLSKKSDFNALEETDEITFNMNNNNFLSRLTKDQQSKMYEIISYAIVDHPSQKCHTILMCNCGLNDLFMKYLCDIIVNKSKENEVNIRELWLESNPIGSQGFKYMAAMIAQNIESLGVIKLYNNKKDIDTDTCNSVIDALQKNTNIVKFVFKFRFQHQRDRLEKILRRNQNLKRKIKLKSK